MCQTIWVNKFCVIFASCNDWKHENRFKSWKVRALRYLERAATQMMSSTELWKPFSSICFEFWVWLHKSRWSFKVLVFTISSANKLFPSSPNEESNQLDPRTATERKLPHELLLKISKLANWITEWPALAWSGAKRFANSYTFKDENWMRTNDFMSID